MGVIIVSWEGAEESFSLFAVLLIATIKERIDLWVHQCSGAEPQFFKKRSAPSNGASSGVDGTTWAPAGQHLKN